MSKTLLLTTVALIMFQGLAMAHFHMIIPEKTDIQPRKELSGTLFWGHPYEHIVFQIDKPSIFKALSPSGEKIDITATPDGKKRTFKFTPTERGDYLLYADFEALYMEEDELFSKEYVKIVTHCMVENGWSNKTGQAVEFVPLTRPYGLRAGNVFAVQLLHNGKPAPGIKVLIEKYNPKAPEQLPDEPLITRSAITDPNGVVIYTLDEPGLWIFGGGVEGKSLEKDGKQVPLEERAVFIVPILP